MHTSILHRWGNKKITEDIGREGGKEGEMGNLRGRQAVVGKMGQDQVINEIGKKYIWSENQMKIHSIY